jgi:hypothetical protein
MGNSMTKILLHNKNSFLELIDDIESRYPLEYNEETNTLFMQFTEELDKLTEYTDSLAKRLNTIWAHRGFSLEKHFAKQQNIQSFDFYPKYKNLMKRDSLVLRKVMRGRTYEKVIFIGSGPLPLSLKLLRINIPKVGYDIMKEALSLSSKSVAKDRFGRKIIYKEANFFELKIEEKKPVIIYIAGLIQGKREGIARLMKQLPKGSLIVIRTVANDKRKLLYERLQKNDFFKFGKVKEFNPTKSSGIVNGMIVIERK